MNENKKHFFKQNKNVYMRMRERESYIMWFSQFTPLTQIIKIGEFSLHLHIILKCQIYSYTIWYTIANTKRILQISMVFKNLTLNYTIQYAYPRFEYTYLIVQFDVHFLVTYQIVNPICISKSDCTIWYVTTKWIPTCTIWDQHNQKRKKYRTSKNSVDIQNKTEKEIYNQYHASFNSLQVSPNTLKNGSSLAQ